MIDVYQTCMEKIRAGIHLQRYDSRKKLVEDLDEGEVKEAGSYRTSASKTRGPSWSDNRFIACRFGQVVVMGVVKIDKNSISASERSQIEKSINAWAIHTPSLLPFSYYGLLT